MRPRRAGNVIPIGASAARRHPLPAESPTATPACYIAQPVRMIRGYATRSDLWGSMTAPIDYQPHPGRPRSSRFPTVVVVLLVLIGLTVVFFRPLLGLVLSVVMAVGSSK